MSASKGISSRRGLFWRTAFRIQPGFQASDISAALHRVAVDGPRRHRGAYSASLHRIARGSQRSAASGGRTRRTSNRTARRGQPVAGLHDRRGWSHDALRTVISLRVRVPVLSVQMTDADAQGLHRRQSADDGVPTAIRCTPIASVIVRAGSPRGSPPPRGHHGHEMHLPSRFSPRTQTEKTKAADAIAHDEGCQALAEGHPSALSAASSSVSTSPISLLMRPSSVLLLRSRRRGRNPGRLPRRYRRKPGDTRSPSGASSVYCVPSTW